MKCGFWAILSFFLVTAHLPPVIAVPFLSQNTGAAPWPPAEYHILPPLREQASIWDEWAEERRAGIPRILRKYGIGAWLVSLGLRRKLRLTTKQVSSGAADQPKRVRRGDSVLVS